MKDKNKNNEYKEIIESSNPENIVPSLEQKDFKYDFMIAEAAFGTYEGVSFTISGILITDVEGEQVLTTYLDIEKSRFVDIVDGTEFELKEGVNLKVVKIEKENDKVKGKIYFKKVQ